MKPNPKHVGERIKIFRTQLGLTMQQLGKTVDALKGTVNNWEKGVSLPSKERITILAELFEISEETLLYGSIESYLKELFQYPQLEIQGVDDNFFTELEKEMLARGVLYPHDKEIFELAEEVQPAFYGDENYHYLLEFRNIVKNESKRYRIEQDDMYRHKLLPYIDEVLATGFRQEFTFDKIQVLLMFLRFNLQIETTKEISKLGTKNLPNLFDPDEDMEMAQLWVDKYGSRLIKGLFHELSEEKQKELAQYFIKE